MMQNICIIGSLPITKQEKLEQVELEVPNLKDLALALVWFGKEIHGTRSQRLGFVLYC